MSALLGFGACSTQPINAPTMIGTAPQDLNLTVPPTDDLESYVATDVVDGETQNGGQGWTSPWYPLDGEVSVSDDVADSGSLSFKFGATSSDSLGRDLLHLRDSEMQRVAVQLADTADAVATIELLDGSWGRRFAVCLNCNTVGQISAYDDVDGWTDVGAFVPNTLNTIGLVTNQTLNLMDVYLDSSLLVSGINASGSIEVSRLTLSTVTANGELVYMDSIQDLPVVPATEDFEDYSDGDSLDTLDGGEGWYGHTSSATPQVSSWETLSGTATITDEEAFSGSNSLKLGETSAVARELLMGNPDQLDIAFFASASLDAKATIEIRCKVGSAYYQNVEIALNRDTAGKVSVYDANFDTRPEVGDLVDNDWNLLSIYNDPNTGTFTVNLDSVELASGIAGAYGGCMTHVYLTSDMSNGEVILFDGIQQTRWYDDGM